MAAPFPTTTPFRRPPPTSHSPSPSPLSRLTQMLFKVKIQNLGKLADATIQVRPFTVLAGRNNTGKSFFSKSLYSVFNAVNAKHALVEFSNQAAPLREYLERAEYMEGNENGNGDKTSSLLTLSLSELIDSVNRMGTVAESCSLSGGSVDAPVATIPMSGHFADLKKAADDVRSAFGKFKPHAAAWISAVQQPSPFLHETNFIVEMEDKVNSLCEIGDMTVGHIIVRGLEQKISRNFSENFQVDNLPGLKGPGESGIAINVEGVGKFGVETDGKIKFLVEHAGLLQLQRFSRVIYLESPVLWKLKSALEHVRNSPRFFFSGHEQPMVPRYFYDLADALGKRYTDDTDFSALGENLAKSVGGKIVLSSNGEMIFQEDGRGGYPLSLTAMGVANLGVLAMLVERKVIGKGAFVFIDEPEAHLHPEWQVVMMGALYELVCKGVYVVIATHSVDILKWLEVHVKHHPKDKELFALNHFTREGVKNGDRGFSEKLDDIQNELSAPYHNLYISGLGK